MAEGSILVGSARVAIVPDMSAFGADLKAKFDAEVRGLDLKMPVRFDMDQASLARILATARTLGDEDVNINVGARLDEASMGEASVALRAWLDGQHPDVLVGARLDKASMGIVNAGLKTWLDGQRDDVKIGAELDKTDLAAAAAALKAFQLQDRPAGFDRTINASLQAEITTAGAMKQAADKLRTAQEAVGEAEAFTSGEAGKLAYLQDDVAVAEFKAALGADAFADGSASVTEALGALGEAEAFADREAAKLTLTASALSAALDEEKRAALGAALAATGLRVAGGGGTPGGAGGGSGGGGGGAARSAFSRGFLGGTIGGVSAWHVALDLAAESLIAVGTAAMAMGAGFLVAEPAADNLRDHLVAVDTVSNALDVHLKPLSGQLASVQHAMAPQVIEGYGGALALLNSQGGVLTQTGRQVVTMFDDWIARMDLWAKGEGTMSSLLQSGEGYLAQFGSIFGNVGAAIGGLLRDDPGIAHYLLDLVEAGTKLLYGFSRLPAPIVYTTLAIHGLYLWGRVLGGAMISAAKGLGILTAAQAETAKGSLHLKSVLTFFATNPLAWIGVAAAALAYFTFEGTQADSATKKLITTLNEQLANEKASTAILQLTDDIGTLQQRINTVGSATGLKQIDSQWNTFGNSLNRISYTAASRWESFLDLFKTHVSVGSWFGDLNRFITGSGGAAKQQTADLGALNHQIDTYLGQARNMWHETGILIGQGHTYSQALALMDLAGVRAGDNFTLMRQKVNNLISGYESMSIRGTLLSNSVNAVTFSTVQQDSKVAQLTQAWSAFFSMLTGGESGMVAFAQGSQTLTKDLAAGAADAAAAQGHLASAQGRVVSAQQSINALSKGPSLSSLTSATDRLKAAQDHLTAVQATGHVTAIGLVSAQDRLSAAQNNLSVVQKSGGATTDQLTSSQDRLKAAQDNLTVTQGKYSAATTSAKVSLTGLNAASLTARQQFLTTAQAAQTQMNALMTLASAAGLGARGTRLLGTAGKDMVDVLLPAAKHSQALTAILYGLAQQAGYQGADAFKSLSTWVGNTRHPMQQLDSITTTLTVHAGDLATDVRNLSTGLAETLTDAEKTAIFYASGGQKAFDAYATSLSHNSAMSEAVRTSATDLAAQLIAVTGSTQNAHKEFDAMTVSMGVSKGQADKLWNSIQQIAEHEAALKNKHFTVTGTGKGSYRISDVGLGPVPDQGAAKSAKAKTLLYGASGAYVSDGTTPVADDVLARVSKGEVIVPAKMVSSGEVDHLRGKIPGFAAGGYTGDVAGLAPFTTQFGNQLADSMAGGILSAMTSAATAAASSGGFGIPGAAAAGTGTAQAIARRLLAAMGWSKNQWAALDYLWTRESGWRWDADNPSSGAYGIPQSLPADKMASAGADWRTNPATQIRWGLGYIKAVYGDPDGAAAHEVSHGWYDQGGLLPPGLTLAANLTGQNEFVLTAAQLATLGTSGGGSAYHAHFDGLTGQAIEGHVRTAFSAMQVAEAHHLRIGRPQ